MRYLPTVMISLGLVLLILPVGVFVWFWLARFSAPAYQDTYYVVAHGPRLALYFVTACGLVFCGFWLRKMHRKD